MERGFIMYQLEEYRAECLDREDGGEFRHPSCGGLDLAAKFHAHPETPKDSC